MNERKTPHLAVRILLGLATTASLLVSGAVVGLVVVKLFVPKKQMGWDGLADALGGMMLGGLLGLFLGVVLAIRLAPRGQLIVLAVAAGLFAACWLYLSVGAGEAVEVGQVADARWRCGASAECPPAAERDPQHPGG